MVELFSPAKPRTIYPRFLAIAIACLVMAIVAPCAIAQADQAQDRLARRTWLVQPLEPQEVARLERLLEQSPEDIPSRIRLLYAYVAAPDNERRAWHLLWLIEHHPETPNLLTGEFVFREPGPLQDVVSYNRAAEAWKHQAELHPSDGLVISNAARFLREYYYLEDPFQMERWVLKAAALDPANPEWRDQLARDYALALVNALSGRASSAGKQFATHVRAELEGSSNCTFLLIAGTHLQMVAQHPPTPEMLELQAYSKRLVGRSQELGCQPPVSRPVPGPSTAGSKTQASAGPQPIRRVEPVYPAAAAQIQLRGIVRLHIWLDRSGAVRRSQVITGHPLFQKPAQDAVAQWLYPPQDFESEVDVEVTLGPSR